MDQPCSEWRSAGGGDRHEERGVVEAQDGVGLLALEVEQLTALQLARDSAGGEGDAALQAMDGDLAPGLVGGDLLAPGDDQTDDLQALGLDEGSRPRVGRRRPERADIDVLARLRVWDRHEGLSFKGVTGWGPISRRAPG